MTPDKPNVKRATQDNTVKKDRPRAFLAFLAKRVLPLAKNARNAPRAISRTKKSEWFVPNARKVLATRVQATLVASAHPRVLSSTPPMESRTALKVFTAKVVCLEEFRAA